MRNIKKTIKVRKMNITVYDRVAKEERTITVIVPEVHKTPEIPHNCVLIEEAIVEEKEVTYSMSPETFVEHATIVE